LSDLLEYTRQVRAFGRRRDYAIPYAERAVELYPDSVDAILLLVDVLPPTQAEKDRVEQLLNRAATIEPTNARIYTTRGWWNLHTFRRTEDAEKDFRQALSVSNNTDPTAWKGLGYVFMERGQKHDAVVAFRKYLSLNKNGTPDSEIVQLIESLEHDSR
jgi:Tfp pilus assembly protein PilF